MKTRWLSKTEKEMFGADVAIVIDYNDVAGYTDATAAAILSVLAGHAVSLRAMKLITAFDFSDASINSLTLKLGDGGDDDRFLTATQVAIDGTEILYIVGTIATNRYAYLVDDTVDVIFTVLGGGSPTEAECTSGELVLYLSVEDLNQLPNR